MTTETLHKTLNTDFEAALERVPQVLATKGFGVLTTIDVSATLDKKLGVKMPRYTILGACNPKMAHEALTLDPTAGVLLPCNVVVRQLDQGVEVRAVDPEDTLGRREALSEVAAKVRALLEQAIAAL